MGIHTDTLLLKINKSELKINLLNVDLDKISEDLEIIFPACCIFSNTYSLIIHNQLSISGVPLIKLSSPNKSTIVMYVNLYEAKEANIELKLVTEGQTVDLYYSYNMLCLTNEPTIIGNYVIEKSNVTQRLLKIESKNLYRTSL